MIRPRWAALLPMLAATLIAGAGDAQTPRTAVLRGTVLDASSSIPLVGARVVVGTTGRVVETDSVGQFEVTGLASGIVRFWFTAEGFPQASVVLAFAPGEVMERRFEMDSSTVVEEPGASNAQPLPAARVTAEASRGVRYEDFERRMKTGRGHYVTREQIETAGYSDLVSAVRTLRGVSVECGGGRACVIRMSRAGQGCYPEYVVDGVVDNFFGPHVAIRDIEALEVYTGASDVPGEFAGRTAACGVVVIWTKAGPVKRPPG